MSSSPLPLIAALLGLLWAGPAAAQEADDAALIAGFNSVVFSAEITGAFSDAGYLKKFVRPVRFRIDQISGPDRREDVARFIAEVDALVGGLETRIVAAGEPADFVVHIVDRQGYQERGRLIYGDPSMEVPGNCIVRASFSPRGLRRSDAILVADEGERRFRRCMVEEILQGLGPLNDNAQAAESVFNDTSRLIDFTPYDQIILNMLYDPRLRPGMREADVAPLLPAVLTDARQRLALD